MSETPDAVFAETCPNCQGPISSIRLEKGIPCRECVSDYLLKKLETTSDKYQRLITIKRHIRAGKEGVYTYLYDILSELREFELFFSSNVGHDFWDLQRTWALRLVMGESFAITAPTGVGKTTLLLNYAVFKARLGKRVYVLVPTESLLNQIGARISVFAEKNKEKLRIVVYNSRTSKAKREEILEKIRNGDFDILITTTGFLSRRFDLISHIKFDIVIVDDADSLLKNSKNIDRILLLIGFSEEDVKKAYNLIKAKRDYIFYKLAGKEDKAQEKIVEIEELKMFIEESKATKSIGQLTIASATGRQVGLKPKLFRELLDFEVGGIHDYMRNIVESYTIVQDKHEVPNKVLEVIKKLGNGGLVFVSKDRGSAYARLLVDFLNRNGVKAALAVAGRSAVKKLEKGEVEVLVGVASYYGVIVRGIDLPKIIKYAIFVGVPKNRILLEKALQSPRRLIQLYTYIEKDLAESNERIKTLIKRLEKLHYGELLALRIALANNTENKLEGKLRELAEEIKWCITTLKEVVDSKLSEKGSKLDLGTSYIEKSSDGKLYFVTPDVMTYIQASGRTSRFLNNKMTLGYVLIIENDYMPLKVLSKRITNYVSSFNIIDSSKLDYIELKERLEKSRKTGEGAKAFKPAKSIMIVVESPNKARTIARYFGKPSRRKLADITVYETPIIDPETLETYLALIVATKGHMYDLVIDDNIGFHGVLLKSDKIVPVFAPIKRCVACGYTFSSTRNQCPRCGEKVRIRTSRDVIQAMRRLALEVREVIIATDPDVEGEKIAWDVYLTLRPFNLSIKRIEYNEVTKTAILNSLRKPRDVSLNRVEAQLARRITDRWIGFTLSKNLWKIFNKHWLGAGRVQTPVLNWIVDNYNKWKETRGYWVLVFSDNLPTIKLFKETKNAAEKLAKAIQDNPRMILMNTKEWFEEIKPGPPFTTDEVLNVANKVLGFSANFTMKILQDLFEAGLITYHRTDSTRVSSKGISIASSYIVGKLEKPDLLAPRTWGEGGAHEAIRPVHPMDVNDIKKGIADGSLKTPVNLTEFHLRLYDLIFRRFMASQMKPTLARMCSVRASIAGEVIELNFVKSIEKEGHNLVWNIRTVDVECKANTVVNATGVKIIRGSLNSLYTQGDVIKLMKTKGLGRPSTYAKTLENLRRHGYTIVSKRRKYVIPTKLGISVLGYLLENFVDLVSEQRTILLEKQMDLIEDGSLDYRDVLKELLQELTSYNLVQPTLIESAGSEEVLLT